MPTRGLRERRFARHHEAQPLVVVGELLLQIEESRAGDVARLPLGDAALDAIAAAVARPQEHGALEYAHVRIVKMLGEPLG